MKICVKCGQREHLAGADFCHRCGAELVEETRDRTCPRCGKRDHLAHAAFCVACGAELAPAQADTPHEPQPEAKTPTPTPSTPAPAAPEAKPAGGVSCPGCGKACSPEEGAFCTTCGTLLPGNDLDEAGNIIPAQAQADTEAPPAPPEPQAPPEEPVQEAPVQEEATQAAPEEPVPDPPPRTEVLQDDRDATMWLGKENPPEYASAQAERAQTAAPGSQAGNCPVCGRVLRPGDKFCIDCGSPVDTPDPAPVHSAQWASVDTPGQMPRLSADGRRMSLPLTILLGVLGFAALTTVVYFLLILIFG